MTNKEKSAAELEKKLAPLLEQQKTTLDAQKKIADNLTKLKKQEPKQEAKIKNQESEYDKVSAKYSKLTDQIAKIKKEARPETIADEEDFVKWYQAEHLQGETTTEGVTTPETRKMTEAFSGTVKNKTAQKWTSQLLSKSYHLQRGHQTADFISGQISKDLIGFGTQLSIFSTKSVLSSENKKAARQQLTDLIDTTYLLTQKGDFASAKAIFDGLNRERIPDIRSQLLRGFTHRKTRKRFEALEKTFSSEGNYKTLRAQIRRSPGCIPPTDLIMKDLDSARDNVDQIDKLAAMAKILLPRKKIETLSRPEKVSEGDLLSKMETLAKSENYTLNETERQQQLEKADMWVNEQIQEKKGFGKILSDSEINKMREQKRAGNLGAAKGNKESTTFRQLRRTFLDRTKITLE